MGAVPERLRGITFTKQYPNPAEPLRGTFVETQVAATAHAVEWEVVAPVPWAPRWLSSHRRPHVRGDEVRDGIRVAHPAYLVLPRRLAYTSVARMMASASARAFSASRRRLDPQFVHAHTLYPAGSAALRLARKAVLPLVVTVHGSDLYSNLERPEWRQILCQVAREAACVICVSPSLARDVRTELRVDAEKIVVVPDAYDDTRFRYIERAQRGGPVRLVTVGRLVEVKGFDLLLAALSDAVSRGLDARLAIVGQGPERDALSRQADDLGLADRVTFTGALSPERLMEQLADSDLFVSPSRAEGFGVALVEAMATGLPAIATRSGGPGGIVTSEVGVLVEPGDVPALAGALLGARQLIEDCDGVRVAESMRERFSPSAVGDSLVAVYRAVLAAKPDETEGVR